MIEYSQGRENGVLEVEESSLEEKEEYSLSIIKESFKDSKNPFISFSGGKKSLVLLHLARRHSSQLNVLHINTALEFDSLLSFVEKMRRLWRFNLIRAHGECTGIKAAESVEECCDRLLIRPLNEVISGHKIDRLFLGTINSSDGARAFNNSLSKIDCPLIVQPISQFTERDVWRYIKKHNLLYCSLYEQGYSNLDCMPCTKRPIKENVRNNEDEMLIKERLKKLGYL